MRQRDLRGGRTRPTFSHISIILHLDTYFSIVRLKAAYASRESSSTSFIITVLKGLRLIFHF